MLSELRFSYLTSIQLTEPSPQPLPAEAKLTVVMICMSSDWWRQEPFTYSWPYVSFLEKRLFRLWLTLKIYYDYYLY